MSNRYRLHLHPNGYFYHRVKVPADIRQLYGKQIEQRSLRTRDLRDAVRRLPAVIVEVDRAFTEFRAEYADELGAADSGNPPGLAERLTRRDFRRVAAEFAKSVEAEEFGRRAAAFKSASQDIQAYLGDLALQASYAPLMAQSVGQDGDVAPTLRLVHRLHINARIAAVMNAGAAGDFHRWETAVDERAPGLEGVQRVTLVRMMIDAELKALAAWQDEPERGHYPATKGEAVTSATALVSVCAEEQMEPTSVDLPLMSVISRECFEAIGREKKWSAKTEAARHMQIKQFIEICGDKPLNRYTQNSVRHLKAILFAIPPQSHGKKEFKGLSKVQVAEKAKRLGLPGLSVESVRQIMTAANLVFNWARAEHDKTLQNIVQPMIPPSSSGGSKKGRRQGFTSGELKKLFDSPVFTGVESAEAWFKSGHVRMQHTGRFWVPLLALYAGARLMETVQLYREDVGCQSSCWFIDINNDDEEQTGKTVKNVSSVRRIPVHPELIKLGFLEFVATVSEGQRLFPDISIGPPTQRHRHASKMFNKLLAVAGIKGRKKVWHSLRHSFEQACRDSRVDSAIMDQLQGHSQGIREIYGEGYRLHALNDGIQSIRYEGLNLSHIHPFSMPK